MKRFICAVSAVFVCCIAFAAVRLSEMGFVEDIAGVAGKRAYAGDGGDAQYARFANPMGLAIDRWNNIYIADTRNHRVRRINVRTGEIETIAGTGKAGFANDGGNANMAELNGPTALAFDSIGNLYIADTGNQRIRLLDIKGYLHTIAGNGRRGCCCGSRISDSADSLCTDAAPNPSLQVGVSLRVGLSGLISGSLLPESVEQLLLFGADHAALHAGFVHICPVTIFLYRINTEGAKTTYRGFNFF